MRFLFFYFMIYIWSTSERNELNKNTQNYSSEESSDFKLKPQILNIICKLIKERANSEVKNNLKEIMSNFNKFTNNMDFMPCDLEFDESQFTSLQNSFHSTKLKLVLNAFIKDLNSFKPKNDEFCYYIAHFIRSLKLFYDFSKCKLMSIVHLKKEILENKRQICYRIAIKVSFDAKLQDLKKNLKGGDFGKFVLFFVKDRFFYIDILRICFNFNNTTGEFYLPTTILKMFDSYFSFLRASLWGDGKVELNPKIELSDPKMPFCAFLKVNNIKKDTNDKFSLEFLNSHINILIHFLRRTLSLCWIDEFDNKIYDKLPLSHEYPILFKNGFSITTKYFEQGNSELYMPMFILKVADNQNKKQLENVKAKKDITWEKIIVFSRRRPDIFFGKDDYIECEKFFECIKNTFEVLLPKESVSKDKYTSNISERDQYLFENGFTLLLNHKKIVSQFSDKLSKINNELYRYLHPNLTFNCTEGVSIEANYYDLNTMYDIIME